MKKKVLSCILAVISLVSLVFLSACDELNLGYVSTIINDEKAWNEAFDNLTYANFTAVINYSDESGSTTNSVKVTKDAVHYNIEGQTEFYSVKQNNGTYKTYLKGYDLYADRYYYSNGFTLLNNKTDLYITKAKREAVLKVSFANYFELFTYNEATSSYSYSGEIETTAYLYGDLTIETEKVICTNNEIKVENGKIVYIKFNYTYDNAHEGWNATGEYFDIGKTVVNIPREVVNNSVKDETKEQNSASYLIQQGTSSKPQDNTNFEQLAPTSADN